MMDTAYKSSISCVRLVTRLFTTSAVSSGRKTKDPFDRRYPATGKHINATKPSLGRGGNADFPIAYGRKKAEENPTGIYYVDHNTGKEVFEEIPEMIPEFVVPDLTDFKLTPYVDYRVEETVTQTEFTAKDLFDYHVAPKLGKKAKAEEV